MPPDRPRWIRVTLETRGPLIGTRSPVGLPRVAVRDAEIHRKRFFAGR